MPLLFQPNSRLKILTVSIMLSTATGVAEAKAFSSNSSNIQVTADVDYTLNNLSGDKTLTPVAPNSSAMTTMLNTPTNLGNTVTVNADTPTPFSLYSNAVTPVFIQSTNMAGPGVNVSSSDPMLMGNDSNNNTKIRYQINYTPCGGGAAVNLANQCGNTGSGFKAGCSIPSVNSNFTACTNSPGSVTYTYVIPKQVNADTYTGSTQLTYYVGP